MILVEEPKKLYVCRRSEKLYRIFQNAVEVSQLWPAFAMFYLDFLQLQFTILSGKKEMEKVSNKTKGLYTKSIRYLSVRFFCQGWDDLHMYQNHN